VAADTGQPSNAGLRTLGDKDNFDLRMVSAESEAFVPAAGTGAYFVGVHERRER
jgi:hypothetical protein